MLVTLYTKPECHLCEEARHLLDRLAPQFALQINEVNIEGDPALEQAYGEQIPVVVAGDGRFGRLVAPIGEGELRAYLMLVQQMSARALPQLVEEPAADRVAGYIARNWLRFVLVALGLFVGLPWLAPVLAALGLWDAANVIYTVYAVT